MKTKDSNRPTARLWRSPVEPALELARIEYEDFCFEPHFHEHYVIMLMEKGVNLGRRGTNAYDVLPGEMLVIQPGETHTGSSFAGKALRYLAFYPDPASLARWLDGIEPGTRVPDFHLKYRDPRLSDSFRRLFAAMSSPHGDALATDAALLEFLGALVSRHNDVTRTPPGTAPDSQRLKRAQAYIRGHFADSISLADVAKAAGTSPHYLIRLFRRQSGLTPFEYLRSVRVEKAKALMRSHVSLTAVAHRAGFYDQSHFIRCFKKHTGFLPSEFCRREARAR